MYLKKFALSGVSKLGIFVFNLTSFAFILPYIYMCGSGSVFHIRIWIQKASEYGSNGSGSGSTTLTVLKEIWILTVWEESRIRIVLRKVGSALFEMKVGYPDPAFFSNRADLTSFQTVQTRLSFHSVFEQKVGSVLCKRLDLHCLKWKSDIWIRLFFQNSVDPTF